MMKTEMSAPAVQCLDSMYRDCLVNMDNHSSSNTLDLDWCMDMVDSVGVMHVDPSPVQHSWALSNNSVAPKRPFRAASPKMMACDSPLPYSLQQQPPSHHCRDGMVQCEGDMCSICQFAHAPSHHQDLQHRWDEEPMPSELWVVDSVRTTPRKCVSTAEAARFVGATEVSIILALQSGDNVNGFRVFDQKPRTETKRQRRNSASDAPTRAIRVPNRKVSLSDKDTLPTLRIRGNSLPSKPTATVAKSTPNSGGAVVCSCGKSFSNGQALGGHRKYCSVPRWKPRGKTSRGFDPAATAAAKANKPLLFTATLNKQRSGEPYSKLSHSISRNHTTTNNIFPPRENASPPRAG